MSRISPTQAIPDQDPSKPIQGEELSALYALAQRTPSESDGWELALEDGGVKVHRVSEVVDEERGKVVELIRCEFDLEAGPVAALVFMKDPGRRKMWDELLGPSFKTVSARGHDFLTFRFEALYGLASKNFLVWNRVQAFDRNGVERAGGEGATTWIMCWRPADVASPGVPRVDDEYDKNTYWGYVAEKRGPSEATRYKIFVRIKYVSSMVTRNVIPLVLQNYTSDYVAKLKSVAISRTWNDSDEDLVRFEAPGLKGGMRSASSSPTRFQANSPRGQAPDVSAQQPGTLVSGAGQSWSPQRGLPKNAGELEIGSGFVGFEAEGDVPAYQLRYEKARKREPPALESLESRLKGALTNWRVNLENDTRPRRPLAAPAMAQPLEQEVAGFRGSDAWLDCLVGSMGKVQVLRPPWSKQEDEKPNSKAPDVWDRIDQAGLGGRGLSDQPFTLSEEKAEEGVLNWTGQLLEGYSLWGGATAETEEATEQPGLFEGYSLWGGATAETEESTEQRGLFEGYSLWGGAAAETEEVPEQSALAKAAAKRRSERKSRRPGQGGFN